LSYFAEKQLEECTDIEYFAIDAMTLGIKPIAGKGGLCSDTYRPHAISKEMRDKTFARFGGETPVSCRRLTKKLRWSSTAHCL